MNGDRRYWVAVASADHARRGKAIGIMQVSHGKGGPLRRLRPGDGVVYYSPTVTFGGKDRLQAFTLIGTVKDDRVYQVDMGEGFRPFRRDVRYLEAQEASFLPLIDKDARKIDAKGTLTTASEEAQKRINDADKPVVAESLGPSGAK